MTIHRGINGIRIEGPYEEWEKHMKEHPDFHKIVHRSHLQYTRAEDKNRNDIGGYHHDDKFGHIDFSKPVNEAGEYLLNPADKQRIEQQVHSATQHLPNPIRRIKASQLRKSLLKTAAGQRSAELEPEVRHIQQ